MCHEFLLKCFYTFIGDIFKLKHGENVLANTDNTIVYTVQTNVFVGNFLQKYAKEHGYKRTKDKIDWNSAFEEIQAQHSDVIKNRDSFSHLRLGQQIKFTQTEMDDIMHKLGMSKPVSQQSTQPKMPVPKQPESTLPAAFITPKPNTKNSSAPIVTPSVIPPPAISAKPEPAKPAPVPPQALPQRPVTNANTQASTLSTIQAKQEAVENEFRKLVAIEWKKAAGENLTVAEKAFWKKYHKDSIYTIDTNVSSNYIGVGGLAASWLMPKQKISKEDNGYTLSSSNPERKALCDRLGYLTQKRIGLEQAQIKQLIQQGKTQEAEALNNDIKKLQYNQQHLDDIPAAIADSTDFSQGHMGDCWFLSSIRALTYTKYGLNIIKQSVIRENNGNVTVKLRGINKSFTFTPKDIQEYTNLYPFSTGNDDVKMLEMAVLRELNHSNHPSLDVLNLTNGFRDSNNPGDPSQIATKDGSFLIEGFKLLTGEDNDNIYLRKSGDKSHDELNEQMKHQLNNQLALMQKYPNRYAATVHFEGSDELVNHHGYCIKRVDKDCIIVVNTWDTSNEIKISKEHLMKYYKGINVFDTWDNHGSNHSFNNNKVYF